MIRHNRRRRNAGTAVQFFSQGLREIGHCIELALTKLMNPALQLARTKRLFAQLVAPLR
jgi:hypothetical protein